MLRAIRKYRLLLLSLLTTGLFLISCRAYLSEDYEKQVAHLGDDLRQRQHELDHFLELSRQTVYLRGLRAVRREMQADPEFYLHIYRNDSLVFWNTNQLPVMRFADIHYPAEGIVHLQNGWYFCRMTETENMTLCASFLIKYDFAYTNADLHNDFAPHLHFNNQAQLSLDPASGYPVLSEKGEYLFSVIPNTGQQLSKARSLILLAALLAMIAAWLTLFFNILSVRRWGILASAGILLLMRILSLEFNWLAFMKDNLVFQSSLYGSSEWFPNFGEYLINVIVICYVFFALIRFLRDSPKSRSVKWLAILLFLAAFPVWDLYLYISEGLIENSSIPLVIDKLFKLDVFSLLAMLSLGVLFFAYFRLLAVTISTIRRNGVIGSRLAVTAFVCGFVYFLLEINAGYRLFVASIFPLLLMGLLCYEIYREKRSGIYGLGLVYLLLFAGVTAFNLAEFNKRKERSERVLFANQLATDQDILTEVEYNNVLPTLKADNFLQRMLLHPVNIGQTEFQEGLERRVFNNFWERYEMEFFLFDENGKPLIDLPEERASSYDEFARIIARHGVPSEINPHMYFIRDNTDSYSYIVRQELTGKENSKGILIITLKSKKLPEEIGFPQLLIPEKARVMNSLENYSVARYYNAQLVIRYGSFNYPSFVRTIRRGRHIETGFSDYDGYSHYILKKSPREFVIISARNFGWVELLTSFSYIFCFFGILLLPFLFRSKRREAFSALTLSVKIQLALVGLVFLSLLGFGWGSGIFVRNQYNEYTNEVISEKLNSVRMELTPKIGAYSIPELNANGNYTEFWLQRFARVFVTDINFYNPRGYLVASSRPRIFNVGLLSEQMNPMAYKNMRFRRKSEFIHQESIGRLAYTSAYLPFFNNDGDLIGYLNLQHFGQQKEFENQIQQFLVAIINVFMLLLAISVVTAIFVSSWVTAPLRLLQESFSRIRFGKGNQVINYDKNDEIGALVKDYNQKLEELEYTADQLAQSERESAWREMAKQVAHEIRNPLTPMKLSIQHLQRVFDPADPQSAEKLKRVAESVIEQIDALTRIANEFSNFAKMPRANEERTDLIPVIRNVIEVFREQDEVEISLESSVEQAFVMADRNLFVRVFNNLIKNAIQAIPEGRHGKVHLRVSREDELIRVSVSDNGSGIPPDVRDNLFKPYFTTKSTGTGLGLAMVKQIVENHRGSIWYESTEHEGTVFHVELPAIA